MKPGQGHVFGVEGVIPAKFLGEAPRGALQDAVAEEPDAKAPDVVELTIGIGPRHVAAPD